MTNPFKWLPVLMMLIGQCAFAQTDSSVMKSKRRAQAVFVELMGNGVFYSCNYDFRFGKSQKGFGMRAGAGFFGLPSLGILTLPVSLNYLAGTAPHYLEAGIGITYASIVGFEVFDSQHSGVAMVPNIAYRLQPAHKGFFLRLSASPFVTNSGAQFWGGLSLGYKY